jgi:predicted transcriptional regulator
MDEASGYVYMSTGNAGSSGDILLQTGSSQQSSGSDIDIVTLNALSMSSKSDLMFISKQSEVAKAVEKLGLREPVVPPMKILVTDSVNQK